MGPLFDLGKQIHRDVSGMGFSFDLPGEVMAGMLGAAREAVAAGSAAVLGDGNEAGGEGGSGGGEFLEAGVEHASDEGRAFGDTHGQGR